MGLNNVFLQTLMTAAKPGNIRGKANLRLSPHKKWKQRRAGGRG